MAGSGLLVGTALSVIIPEGVSALYSAQHHEGKATSRTVSEVDLSGRFGSVGDY